jgi:hypothetical protein
MANGATPLGFGAAVLPKSTFDPTAFGQQVAGLEMKKQAEVKRKNKEALDQSLESMNPELGKLKWTSPYINTYEGKIKDFKDRNVQWYKAQNGRLTLDQINQNNEFKENTKAEFELLNQWYDDFSKLKEKVLTDPKLNTPENLEKIKKFSNPYEFDKEGVAKAGGILEYISENPIDIQPKKEALDVPSIISRIKKDAGTLKTAGQTYIDPVSNEAVYPSVEEGDLVAANRLGKIEYVNNAQLQEKYTEDEWLNAVAGVQQGKSTTLKTKTLPKDDDAPTRVGGARVSRGIRVSQDEKDLRFNIKRNVSEAPPIPGGARVDYQKVMEENITSKGYVISNKSGKPIELSSHVDNVGIITEDGIELVKGGLMDFKINSVYPVPTSTHSIDLKTLPESMFKKSLMSRAVNGVLPDGLILTPQETKALNNLGFGDSISDIHYAFGEIKNIEKYKDASTGENRFRKSLMNNVMVPYKGIKGQLKNVGFELIEPEKRPKGFEGYKVRSKEGFDYTWNDELGKYE